MAHGLLTPSIVATSRSPNALGGTAVAVDTGAGLPLADAEALGPIRDGLAVGASEPVFAGPVAVPPCPQAAMSSVEIASATRILRYEETPAGDIPTIFARRGDAEPGADGPIDRTAATFGDAGERRREQPGRG